MAKVISSTSAKKVSAQAALKSDELKNDLLKSKEPKVIKLEAKNPRVSQLGASETALISAQSLSRSNTYWGGYAYRIITQQTQKIAELRSLVLSDKDPENLHQMRIATRRLSSALLLLQDAIDIRSKKGKKRKPEKLAKSVEEITKALGSVRDMDVMQQWFTAVLERDTDHRFSKKERKIIETLLKTIKKRRKKRLANMKAFLRNDRYKKPIAQFKKWTKQPTFTKAAHVDASTAAASKIVTPIANLLQHPAWTMASHVVSHTANLGSDQLAPISELTLKQLNQQLHTNGEQLHDLRKQIKRVRYQTEFFRGLYGITYAAQIREFRKLQKVLGGLQDQIVISQFLTNEVGKNWMQKLPTISADFQNSRLELWQQWQPYQAKYLKLHSHLMRANQREVVLSQQR